jgi:hypothetical protein
MKLLYARQKKDKKGECAGDVSTGYLIRIYENFSQKNLQKIEKKKLASLLTPRAP